MLTKRWFLAAACCAALAASDVSAHDGVTHSIEEISEEIAESPTDAKLYLMRANEFRIEDRHADALRDIERARKRGATDEAALLEGRILLEAGRTADAVAVLKGHVDARPNSALGHWLLGRAQRFAGDMTAAAASYERAAKQLSNVDLFAERGDFLASIGEQAAAAAALRFGLERLESDVLREKLARVEVERGRGAAAVAAITPVVERAGLATRWLVLRAEAHEVSGDHARAAADLARALRDVDAALAKRRSPLLLVERARVHRALGDLDAARADAEEAARRAPHYEPATTLHAELRRTR